MYGTCLEPNTLTAYSLGLLEEDSSTAIEQHLECCEVCLKIMGSVSVHDPVVTALQTTNQVDSFLLGQLTFNYQSLKEDGTQLQNAKGLQPESMEAHNSINTSPPKQASHDHLPLQAATKIGRFHVLKKLGQGGMSIVYLAHDLQLHRSVAVKVLHDHRYSEKKYVERFRQEIVTVAQLHHSNIVQIYESGEDLGRPFFVMEYLSGGTLAEKAAGQPLPINKSAQLLMTLANAVHYAHQHGVIHRDLKPSNILFQEDTPKIADFGLAKQLEQVDLTKSGELLGTPGYLAPELINSSQQQAQPASDIYALGAILYELLIGRPPFQGLNAFDTLVQMRQLDPVLLRQIRPEVPQDIETICLKCLERDPLLRYPSAENLAKDLERYLTSQPILARPSTRMQRIAKWVIRHPTATLVTLASVIFIIILLAGTVLYNFQLQEIAQEMLIHKQRADHNYQVARDTLGRLLSRLDRPHLADIPQLKELQKDQLVDALEFYREALVELSDPTPEVRLDAAKAYIQTAKIHSDLGQPSMAEQGYQQALNLAEGLIRDFPYISEYQSYAAHAWAGLSHVAAKSAQGLPKAEKYQSNALAIRQRLAAQDSLNPSWQSELAQSHHAYVLLLNKHLERLTEFEEHAFQGIQIYETLVQQNPRNEKYQSQLAELALDAGHTYDDFHKSEKAKALFDKAEPLLRALVKGQPNNIDHQLRLARYFQKMANRSQDPQEKLRLYNQAESIAESVLRQEPNYVPARRTLLAAHGGKAYTYQFNLNNYDAALAEWDKVVELDDGPTREFRQSERLVVIVRLGDFRRATREGMALAKIANAGQGDALNRTLYNLADVFSLAAQSVQEHRGLSETERSGLVEEYSKQAVTILECLLERGFFNNPFYLKELKHDPSLQPIRVRQDFQALVNKVEKSHAK